MTLGEEPEVDALIVVDLQRAFVVGPHAVPDGRRLLATVDSLVTRARAAGRLVVHLQNDGSEGAPDEAGTEGWQLALTPAEGEPVIRKKSDDGFTGTGLDEVLRRNHVSCVVIAGLQSEMCVAATARGALERGLRVVLPRDAHATCPIPEEAGLRPAVPAEHVHRVAEWSLGDTVILAKAAADVRFD